MIGPFVPVRWCALAVALTCLAAFLPAGAQDSKEPLPKAALLTAIGINGISTEQLLEIINRRGLAFPMSIADEQEFRKAGAADLVIDAMWEKEYFEIKPGPPLTQEGIIESLQAGVPPRRLERMVRLRSAKVTLNREVADKIKSASGTDALLGTILANIYEPPPPPPPPVGTPAPSGAAPPDAGAPKAAAPNVVPPPKPDPKKHYDELVGQAGEMRKAGSYGRAADLLSEAKKLDPQRPEAYAMSGLVWMMSVSGVLRAGAEYTSAIERDGEVTVPMLHLHGHTATLKEKSCRGYMTISRKVVTYSSPAGHRYTIETSHIGNVSINTSKITLGALGGSFHISWSDPPVRQEEQHFRVDINKDDREADRMIVELIRKCLVH